MVNKDALAQQQAAHKFIRENLYELIMEQKEFNSTGILSPKAKMPDIARTLTYLGSYNVAVDVATSMIRDACMDAFLAQNKQQKKRT